LYVFIPNNATINIFRSQTKYFTNMKNFNFLLATLFCFATASLSAQSAKETRQVGAFDEISISGGYDNLTIREGNEESVTIEASGVQLDKIVTKVKGKTLEIGMKNGSYRNCKINIAITYKHIETINNSGSTDVVVETPIKGDSFTFNTSGSGNFKGSVQVKKLEINISGSSNIDISGQAEAQEYAISGSGDVDASKCNGKSADVAISGSGDVALNVNGAVQTSVSGSGHVRNNN
jgi:hypothetical protein